MRNAFGLRRGILALAKRNWLTFLVVLAIEIFTLQLHQLIPALSSNAFSEAGVAVLAGTVGVFLSFRFNEAYSRWWEARTIWGGIVNASRSFARQVHAHLNDDMLASSVGVTATESASIRRELVYRQIAWVNALRLGLREQPALPELEPFLPPDESRGLRHAVNLPTQILVEQAARLAALVPTDAAGQLILSRFDRTLTELTAKQGGAERIKNTAFPDRVIHTSRRFVWVVAVLVALAFIDPIDALYPLEFVVVMAIILSFKVVAELGEDLSDPFENRINDTPMTALCRTIEIDLRQSLGEHELPAPIEPEDGVLM